MDLLGSILDKMEKPPVIKKNEKEQELIKKQQEKLKQIDNAEKEKLKKFKQSVQTKLDALMGSDEKCIKFKPMEHLLRSVIHSLAEDMELRSLSIGLEGSDRHVQVYKPEHFPCDDEIACLKRNEVYDPEKIRKRKEAEQQELKESKQKPKGKVAIADNYRDKYKHLIGDEAGKSAAQIATPNSSFGVVPSSNKRDCRSIEQTLSDIKRKKQKALGHEEEGTSQSADKSADQLADDC